MPSLPINSQLAIGICDIPNAFSNGVFNVGAIDKAIQGLPGIRVDELKLVDLMFCACHCNGVYLFCDPEGVLLDRITKPLNSVQPTSDVVYVGKSSSRSLVERIAAHFAPRDWDFMNTLMKRITQVVKGSVTNQTICESYEIAEKLYLKIIYFDVCDDDKIPTSNIGKLERDLIRSYRPILNSIPGYRNKGKSVKGISKKK